MCVCVCFLCFTKDTLVCYACLASCQAVQFPAVFYYMFLMIRINYFQLFISVDKCEVVEVQCYSAVALRKKPIHMDLLPSSLWYRDRDMKENTFKIILVDKNLALKVDVHSNQVILSPVDDGDKWKMDGSCIVSETGEDVMYIGEHDILMCGKKNDTEVKKAAFTCRFETTVRIEC